MLGISVCPTCLISAAHRLAIVHNCNQMFVLGYVMLR